MKFIQSLQGVRTAIMAIVLLLEVLAKSFGFEAGPVFTIVRTAFGAIGWNTAEANTLFDPALVGAAIVTLYAAIMRVVAWSKQPKTV